MNEVISILIVFFGFFFLGYLDVNKNVKEPAIYAFVGALIGAVSMAVLMWRG